MTTEIIVDIGNGSDISGNGTSSSPYKTLEYVCNTVIPKTNVDHIIELGKGTYEITTGTIFGQFTSGNLVIKGNSEKTEILQKTGMYVGVSGGYADFSLTIVKCRYNILTTLTSNNLIGINWAWTFQNVLFEYTPNNDYAVFSTLNNLIFKNCVKLTSTTNFLRKNTGTISIYDSIGYFTSGYQTIQTDWDKGGNTVGSIVGYERFLKRGQYPWVINKSLIYHDGEYKRWDNKPYIQLAGEYPKQALTGYNSDPNFIVSASSEWGSGYVAWAAFTKTNTGGYDRYPTGAYELSGWLKVQLSSPLLFSKYTVEATARSGEVLSTIKDWTLEGSNDNAIWSVIDTQSQTNWSLGEARTFLIKSPAHFLYYRLNFKNNNGYSSNTQIGELRFYAPELIDPLFGFSVVSSILPSSEKFLSDGMDSLSPLFDRQLTTLEPLPMDNKNGILQAGEVGKTFSKTLDLNKYIDIRSMKVEVE